MLLQKILTTAKVIWRKYTCDLNRNYKKTTYLGGKTTSLIICYQIYLGKDFSGIIY